MKRLTQAAACLLAAAGLLSLTSCATASITQTTAGYVMYPNADAAYTYGYSDLELPNIACLPNQTSKLRWYTALDGVPGAANQRVAARVGVILGCVSGQPTYTPFYGLYGPGQENFDHHFHPVKLYAGDQVLTSVSTGPFQGDVEFQMVLDQTTTAPKRPTFSYRLQLESDDVTGSAVGCLMQTPSGTTTLPAMSELMVLEGCEARTDWSLKGMFWAPNHGTSKFRGFNLVTNAGKPLTSLYVGNQQGPFSSFSILWH